MLITILVKVWQNLKTDASYQSIIWQTLKKNVRMLYSLGERELMKVDRWVENQ